MDENAKRRLVGAAVLVALMVIFVPMLVDRDDRDDQLGEPIVIPNPPDFDSRFDASVEPSAGELDRPVRQPLEPVRDPVREPFPEDSALPPRADAQDLRPSPVRPESARPEPIRVEREPIKPVSPSTAATSRPTPVAKPTQESQPPPPPKGVITWVVQVASLSVPDAATKLRDQLRAKGYSAFIEEAEINDATFYRVRVGPESDRARADQMATAIGAITGGAPLVQQYR